MERGTYSQSSRVYQSTSYNFCSRLRELGKKKEKGNEIWKTVWCCVPRPNVFIQATGQPQSLLQVILILTLTNSFKSSSENGEKIHIAFLVSMLLVETVAAHSSGNLIDLNLLRPIVFIGETGVCFQAKLSLELCGFLESSLSLLVHFLGNLLQMCRT